MKKLRLFSLAGITLIAVAQAGWAGPHGGGGGGGFGGGFGAGGGGHFGGGGRVGGLSGAPHFGGGGFSAPYSISRGAAYRGGGVGFGAYRPSTVPHVATAPTHARSVVPSRSTTVQSSGGRPTPNLANVGRCKRPGHNQRHRA